MNSIVINQRVFGAGFISIDIKIPALNDVTIFDKLKNVYKQIAII